MPMSYAPANPPPPRRAKSTNAGCVALLILGGILGALFILQGRLSGDEHPGELTPESVRAAQAAAARAERERFNAMTPMDHALAAIDAMGPPSNGLNGQMAALRHLEAVGHSDRVAAASAEVTAAEILRRRGETPATVEAAVHRSRHVGSGGRGPHCVRGCPCGNSCIPCSHRCRH